MPTPPASLRETSSRKKTLLAQVLERHLDSLVIEFLIIGPKLIATAGGSIEELDHFADWGVRFAFELGCAADINGTIEV